MIFRKICILRILSAAVFIFFIQSALYAQSYNTPKPDITVSSESNNSFLKIFVNYTFPQNYHQTFDPQYFKAEIISPSRFQNYTLDYAEGITKEGVTNYYKETAITILVDTSNIPNGEYNLEIKACFQLCDNEGICYLPGSETVFHTINISAAKKENFFKYILFALLGGLLLNLMPCVFPLLAVKTLSLAMQNNNDKKKIFKSSLFYSFGILVSLLILAIVSIVLKAAGSYAPWGFYMQENSFVIALSAVIFVFALSMFDMFLITIPGINFSDKISLNKGYLGQFLTGIFAVVVAAPCTAPFLGSAVAFALSKSSVIILLIFIFTGIGFALPFFILGLNPQIINKLPKPGKWSVILKEVLGFVLIFVAIYIISPVLKRSAPGFAVNIFCFFAITAFAVWLFSKFTANGASLKKVLPALLISAILISSAWIILIHKNLKISYESNNITAEIEEDVFPFSTELLGKLLSENSPVFIKISADWCTTCKINDIVVFSQQDVKDFFKNNGITILEGDFTLNNPEIARWMKLYNKAGVPVYAFYHNKKSFNNPVFLPELLTKNYFFSKMEEYK